MDLAARGCVGMMLRMQIVSSDTLKGPIWPCSLGKTQPLNSLSAGTSAAGDQVMKTAGREKFKLLCKSSKPPLNL